MGDALAGGLDRRILGSLAGGLVYGYGGPAALFLTCAAAAVVGGGVASAARRSQPGSP